MQYIALFFVMQYSIDMTPLNIFMLVIAGINLCIGVVVFIKNLRSSLHQSFLMFCAGSSLWTASYVLLTYSQLLVFDRLTILGALISTAGIFLLSRYFPIGIQHVFSKKDLYSILPIAACSILLLDNLIIRDVSFVNSYPVPENGPLFIVFAIILLAYLGLSIYYLIKNFKHANPIEQNKVLIFTFSLAVFIVVALVFDLLLPVLGYSGMNYIGPLFLCVFVIASAYTLLAKRLLDITIILQNTFIYSALLTCVILLYYLLMVLIEGYVVSQLHLSVNTGFTSIIIVAMSVPYLDKRLRVLSDRWLGANKYNYVNSLLDIVKEIAKTHTLEDTIEKVTQRISLVMNLQETRIAVAHYRSCLLSNDPVFGANNTSVFIPIMFHKNHIATLSVKNKISGAAFTNQDVDFLQTVCVYLSTHLRTLRLLQETQQYSHTLEGEIKNSEIVTEQLHESQNKMVVDIAHNLQTPLTILKGELHSLQRAQKRFSRRDLQKLDVTIDRFSQFVTRLLQAGQINQQQYDMHVFNLSELLHDICEYTQTVAQSQSVNFTYDIQDGVMIKGDTTAFRDALVNILSNAMKYRKKQGKHKVSILLREAQHISISVTDNGIGIDTKDVNHIFKPWYQVNALKQGSGLGLSIAQQTINQHGGTIKVTSIKNRSTCFELVLPQQKTR